MIKLPAFFSDGMVISKKAKIWGWGEPGQKIDVAFLNKKYETVVDNSGRFDVVVESENYGGAYSMTIGDVVLSDVHVGRVWLCGGQSNMEGSIERAKPLVAEYVVDDSRIRMFQVEKGLNFDAPATDVVGEWHVAAGEIMDGLYAVPYFFARQLLMDDETPVGLICMPAGGTPMQGWLPEDAVLEFPDYYSELFPLKESEYVKNIVETDEKRIKKWHDKVSENDSGLAEHWHSPTYDDSTWESKVILDSTGFPEHGVVWLRKSIDLPANVSGKVTLNLGRAENSVQVFVNGKRVCEVDYMYPPCRCTLPDDLLKAGKNLIAVRLVGDANHPQFVPGKNYSLVHAHGQVDLNDGWKWRVGAVMPKCDASTWFYGYPCGVYNHMLAPVLGYSADGMIWYQGESNTKNPFDYKALFTQFVQHVREYYGEDFPIIFNQLANYIEPSGNWEGWTFLREQQRKCLNIPNTAMSVSIDCGEWNDLHPMDKKTVGERLALHARRLAYRENIVSDGPIAVGAELKDKELTIYFENATGLWAKGGHPIVEIIDGVGNVRRVYAAVKGETLFVNLSRHKIDEKIIRFGWTDCPSVTLYNAYNLPASPFEIKI